MNNYKVVIKIFQLITINLKVNKHDDKPNPHPILVMPVLHNNYR